MAGPGGHPRPSDDGEGARGSSRALPDSRGARADGDAAARTADALAETGGVVDEKPDKCVRHTGQLRIESPAHRPIGGKITALCPESLPPARFSRVETSAEFRRPARAGANPGGVATGRGLWSWHLLDGATLNQLTIYTYSCKMERERSKLWEGTARARVR